MEVIPHSKESEEALIGSVLINPEVFKECKAIISPLDLYIQRHREIWQSFERLDGKRADIDLVTVAADLEANHKEIDNSFLTSLVAQSPNSYNAKSYAMEVKDKACRRQQLQIANEIAKGAYNGGVPVARIVSDLIGTTDLKKKSETLSGALSEYYDYLEMRSKDPKEVWGISTGYVDFDKFTGGLHKGHVVMISGAPGAGKSILVSGMVLQSAMEGTSWAVYSMEMSKMDLVNRWVAQLANLSEDALMSGKIPENKWPEITHAIEILENLPIYINDAPRISTTEIRADLSQIISENPVDAVAVDYLELLGDTAENKLEATAQKSRGFREVCRELSIAGVIIQSMTKEGIEAATGGITQGQNGKKFASTQAAMTGVRGPADVMHDADTVFLLVVDPMDNTGQTIAALPAKKRHGNSSKTPVRFCWDKVAPRLNNGTMVTFKGG